MLVFPNAYAPPLLYIAEMLREPAKIVLDDTEFFQKQTLRNRCYIATSQGPKPLIIPVRHGNKHILQIIPDDTQRWQTIHWRTLVSCYNKSPFFTYYASHFEVLFTPGAFSTLWEFNYALLSLCLSLLTKKTFCLQIKSAYNTHAQQNDLLIRMEDNLPPNPVYVSDINVAIPKYQQVFGTDFVFNLSVLDVLFNLGPQAIDYLHELQTLNLRNIY